MQKITVRKYRDEGFVILHCIALTVYIVWYCISFHCIVLHDIACVNAARKKACRWQIIM